MLSLVQIILLIYDYPLFLRHLRFFGSTGFQGVISPLALSTLTKMDEN